MCNLPKQKGNPMLSQGLMNIESKLWKLKAYAPHAIAVIQKASNVAHYVTESRIPHELAAMSERQFDAVCRKAFHS